MNILERILTGIALVMMPLVGLAASAHQVEQGSRLSAAVYAAVAMVAFVQLARLSWQLHKQGRLHRSY